MRNESYRPAKTVSHFPSLAQRASDNAMVHMFVQDIHTAVMPIGGRSEKRPDFKVQIEGSKEEVDKARLVCGSLSSRERRDDTRLVCDAVQQVAMYLAWQGKTVYEIISGDEPGIFALHNFTIKRLYLVPGFYIQWLPKKEREYHKKKFVIISTRDVWKISMPAALGQASGYKRTLWQLKRFEHLGPKFFREDLENQKQTRDFNFQEYVRENEIYLTRVTKTWGWNRRDYSQRNCTEFYTIYKVITFKWAQAVLREHIINETNMLLQRLGIASRIVVAGLPSANDIYRIRQEFVEGKIDYDQVNDLVSI